MREILRDVFRTAAFIFCSMAFVYLTCRFLGLVGVASLETMDFGYLPGALAAGILLTTYKIRG